ncbi:hypothetical protein V6N13_140413 [Hibiscus sabdariffa]|uniref:Acyl-[acyl-carrier-protein] hydrolase n=1 Tax=Hibiscus sabdariffa TaxID=183260 RepID=A0ABR2QA40_9ROSI
MLKFSSFNVTDLSHNLLQCRFAGSLPPLSFRRCSPRSVSSSSSRLSLTPVQAILSSDASVDSGSGSLANRLRLGGLTGDGLSYKEKFIIRCYEAGINKTATILTIANFLQEVGGNHAQSVGFSTDGFGTTPTMRKLHLIWVTARMHIEIYKYPAWGDVIEIETWGQNEGRIGTRRDWILKNVATGEVIGRATSKWVMMNEDSRQLQKISDDVKEEYLVFCPREPRLAFPEENSKSLKKIAKLEDPAQYSRLGLKPRRSDLDMNRHVNNVTYIGWVLESMPGEIIHTHELQTITLDYRRECQQNDVVDSLTSLELVGATEKASVLHGTNGFATATAREDQPDCHQFLHVLRLSGDGLEINRGRTEWRRKPTR